MSMGSFFCPLQTAKYIEHFNLFHLYLPHIEGVNESTKMGKLTIQIMGENVTLHVCDFTFKSHVI